MPLESHLFHGSGSAAYDFAYTKQSEILISGASSCIAVTSLLNLYVSVITFHGSSNIW